MESKVINYCEINSNGVGICMAGKLVGNQLKCKYHEDSFNSPRCNFLHQNNSWCGCYEATKNVETK